MACARRRSVAKDSLRLDGRCETLHISVVRRDDGKYEAGVVVATFQIYTPPAPLSTYVDFFWLHEEHTQPHTLERALPTGKPALWIELGGDGLRVATQQNPCRMTAFHTSTLFGASSRWSIVAAGRHFARMGVRFTPHGAAAFFAPPASELQNAMIPLDALWGDAAANEFRERLLAETTPAARFQRLELALLARLTCLPPLRPAVTFAVDALLLSPQARTITQAVDQSGLSHRQLDRVFRQEVGISPKRFGRVRRFQEVLNHLGCARQVNWAEIALACGYADQAHLSREFHEFAGVSPTAYLRDRDPSFPTYLPYMLDTPNAVPDPQTADLRVRI
jgi:AraC-like DNA-binding protein